MSVICVKIKNKSMEINLISDTATSLQTKCCNTCLMPLVMMCTKDPTVIELKQRIAAIWHGSRSFFLLE
jgi:hypothetical protein